MLETIIFYVFAIVTVTTATAVVTVKNPIHAALFLVLTFEAEFLAIILVLVYVGAVMVLFLFVVMMLDINIARMREGFSRVLPLGIFVAAIMLALMWSRGDFTGGHYRCNISHHAQTPANQVPETLGPDQGQKSRSVAYCKNAIEW